MSKGSHLILKSYTTNYSLGINDKKIENFSSG